jgi:DNA-binding NtrC family response regulator
VRQRVLVVDDDPGIREAVGDYLHESGFDVDRAASLAEGEERFRATRPDLVLMDHELPDGDALDLIPRLRALDPTVPLVVLTAHASLDLAVRAVKEGAEQFLAKPVPLPTLRVVVERVLDQQRARRVEAAGRSRRARRPDPFLGKSRAIRELEDTARRIVGSDAPVLLRGETGTGKGVLARWLHDHGPRAEEPFVDLNCAGLSREFLETELFGHERGAFTGAVAAKSGLLEVAHRGTVFLDEIGDVDVQVQPKLLKVVEEQRFRRLGDVRDRVVDVRLVAASHHDLLALSASGRFRSDLYYRISTVPLVLPPLRERPEDLPALAGTILKTLAAEMGRPQAELSSTALRRLESHPWPGNVRELRNVLERALLLGSGHAIEERDLRFDTAAPVAPHGEPLTLAEVERRHIERVLATEDGNVPRAARRLGIPRSSLYDKLKLLRARSAAGD